MARRRQSLLEDIIGITARFPWWVGVLLAAVSYVGLHWLASSKSSVAPKDLQNLTGSLGKQLAVALATVLQYVLPLVFLIGSVASIFARRKRNGLYTKVMRADNALRDMTWQDFELLVGEYFRRRGFKVTETGGAGPELHRRAHLAGVTRVLTKPLDVAALRNQLSELLAQRASKTHAAETAW
jgi:restriction system protein